MSLDFFEEILLIDEKLYNLFNLLKEINNIWNNKLKYLACIFENIIPKSIS